MSEETTSPTLFWVRQHGIKLTQNSYLGPFRRYGTLM